MPNSLASKRLVQDTTSAYTMKAHFLLYLSLILFEFQLFTEARPVLPQNHYAVATLSTPSPHTSLKDLTLAIQVLWKRKGGGSGGGHGGSGHGSGSGGHSSDGSSGSRGSSFSSTGGRTITGSGAKPNYGGGRYYGGGAAVPYASGTRSPSGILPVVIGSIAATLIFPGPWLGGAYSYPYQRTYTFYNESASINQTKPVVCLCQRYRECGCDDNTGSAFMNDLLRDGSYSALNRSLVTVAIANNTSTIVINGTLPNGTTASGGSISANAGGSLRYGSAESLGSLLIVTALAALAIS
jgi:hypothetical protein